MTPRRGDRRAMYARARRALASRASACWPRDAVASTILRARTVSTISARKVVRTRTGVRRAECTDVGDVRPRGDVAAHRRTGDVRESHKRHLARTVDGGDD